MQIRGGVRHQQGGGCRALFGDVVGFDGVLEGQAELGAGDDVVRLRRGLEVRAVGEGGVLLEALAVALYPQACKDSNPVSECGCLMKGP
jgi:hypothetical protein